MHRRFQTVFIVVSFFNVLILAIGHIVTSYFYIPQLYIAYEKPVTFEYLLQNAEHINLVAIQRTFETITIASATISVLLIAIAFIFIKMGNTKAFVLTTAAQSIVLLSLGMGLFGLLSIFFSIFSSQPFDGEWLGEHWPVFEANGIWGLCAAIFSIHVFKNNTNAA